MRKVVVMHELETFNDLADDVLGVPLDKACGGHEMPQITVLDVFHCQINLTGILEPAKRLDKASNVLCRISSVTCETRLSRDRRHTRPCENLAAASSSRP